jgi:hypothetical protein
MVYGCAGVVPAPRNEKVGTAQNDDRNAAQRFAAWERSVLTDLATVDPRLSRRLRLAPTEAEAEHATLGAILEEDKGLHVLDGRADIFSFDARARELAAISKRTETRPRTPAAGDESDFESLEAELLSRMVSEERARVNEERRLPRSGSDLLRGIVGTWTLPSGMSEVKERDEWLAARLDELRASAVRAPLRAVEISELEDALDPLEHLTDPQGFARAEGAIARLRIALGAEHAATTGGVGWPALSEGLTVHLGVREPESVLRAEIGRTESRLRDEATTRLLPIPEVGAKAITSAAAELVLVERECDGREGKSPIRSAGPPPERSAVCGALRTIAEATTPSEALAALIAEHDAVAIAQWALAIHLDDRDAEHAPEGHRLLGDTPPEREARLVRFAATHPIACIGVARMASLLDSHGKENRHALAMRWLAYGDAPLDLVERELSAHDSPQDTPAD